jgi:hypothetical protein
MDFSRLTNIDVNGIVAEPVSPRNQTHNATDVAIDVTDIAGRKTVLHKSSNNPILTQVDDLEIFCIVPFEVSLGARGRIIQLGLEFGRYFDANKELLI